MSAAFCVACGRAIPTPFRLVCDACSQAAALVLHGHRAIPPDRPLSQRLSAHRGCHTPAD